MEMDILALALRRAAILNGLLLADHVFIGVVTLDINVATDSQFLTDIARHNADGDQLVLAGGLFAQRIVQRRRNRLFAEILQLIPEPAQFRHLRHSTCLKESLDIVQHLAAVGAFGIFRAEQGDAVRIVQIKNDLAALLADEVGQSVHLCLCGHNRQVDAAAFRADTDIALAHKLHHCTAVIVPAVVVAQRVTNVAVIHGAVAAGAALVFSGEVQPRTVCGDVPRLGPLVCSAEKRFCVLDMLLFLNIRIGFQGKLPVDFFARSGYTISRRFWREYLRMRFRREGGGADYLLFFYIQQVVEIRLSVRIIADQQRPTVYGIVVYGFFRIQNRNGKFRIIPIPAVHGVFDVLGLHIFPPLSVFGQQQHLIQIGGRLHLHFTHSLSQFL